MKCKALVMACLLALPAAAVAQEKTPEEYAADWEQLEKGSAELYFDDDTRTCNIVSATAKKPSRFE